MNCIMLRSVCLAGRGISLLRRYLAGKSEGIHGAVAIEFGIIAPVLILMLVCTVDIGMGIYGYMQVQTAAQAGAEYAIAHGFSSSISAAVTNATSFSGIAASPAPSQFCGCPTNTGVLNAQCNTTCSGGSAVRTYVTVSAQGIYNTILPYPIIPNSFTLVGQSTVRIQ